MKKTETGYYKSSSLAYEDRKDSAGAETYQASRKPSKLEERVLDSANTVDVQDEVHVELEREEPVV